MANYSQVVLQQALYAALTADSALMALVSGVFDFVPQGTAFPYVTIGDLRGSDWSTRTSSGMAYEALIHVHSREGGHRQAALILERIHTLLHDGSLTITGQSLVMMRFADSAMVTEADGLTYRGDMRFKILVEVA